MRSARSNTVTRGRRGELLRRGEAGRARADHGHRLARARRRRLGPDPALGERAVDDGELDRLDRHRVVVDAEHARALARRRAQRAGELREVVGGVQPVDGLAPVVPVDEVVPVRDQVPERAALVTEGDAAVHAARALRPELVLGPGQHDLPPVAHPLLHRPVRLLVALELDEAGDLTHASYFRAPAKPAQALSWGRPRRGPPRPSPQVLAVRARHHRLVHRHAGLLRLLHGQEHALVVPRASP